MKDGKIATLILSVLFLFTGTEKASARQINEVSFTIHENSKLRINGTSNVNDFECFYTKSISNDTLNKSVTFGDSLFFKGEAIQFSTDAFDCGKRAINRDMQSTLKAEEFPFMELELMAVEIADEVPFGAKLAITIAGTHRLENVEITNYSRTDSTITFSGSGDILLTDFNLKPPTALFGLVKVDDQIRISFDLGVEFN